jgi:integrase
MTDQNPPRKPKSELESRTFKDGTIYLFRRADYKKPTWFCRVKVPGVKGYISCSTKTTDEHDAYKFADDVFHNALGRIASGQDITSKKVSVALKEYIDYVEVNEPEKNRYIKVLFLKKWFEFFGNMRLKDINTATLTALNEWTSKKSIERQEQLRKEKKERAERLAKARGDRPKRTHKNKVIQKVEKPEKPIKGLSPNTIKRLSTYQKQFFHWCFDRNYIEALPRSPRLKTEANRRPHFSLDDYNKLTRYFQKYLKVKNKKILRERTMLVNYVLILSNTGIRVGEARTLKWRDIREIPAPENSNQPPDIALLVKGKTGIREVVARTPDVKLYFQRILEIRKKELGGKKPKENDFIFCNRDGLPIGSFKTSFNRLIDEAEVACDSHGVRRSIYSLRHTYATFRLQEGVHQFILAKNMGTSTEMLEKHYGHTSNVASAAELTKGGSFKGDKRVKAVDW